MVADGSRSIVGAAAGHGRVLVSANVMDRWRMVRHAERDFLGKQEHVAGGARWPSSLRNESGVYVCVDDVGADPTHLGSWAAWSLFSVRSSACGAVSFGGDPVHLGSRGVFVLFVWRRCDQARAVFFVRSSACGVASDLVSVDSCDRARARWRRGFPGTVFLSGFLCLYG